MQSQITQHHASLANSSFTQAILAGIGLDELFSVCMVLDVVENLNFKVNCLWKYHAGQHILSASLNLSAQEMHLHFQGRVLGLKAEVRELHLTHVRVCKI